MSIVTYDTGKESRVAPRSLENTTRVILAKTGSYFPKDYIVHCRC